MASIIVHAVYDGRAFVPTEPIELPVGSTLTGSVDTPFESVEIGLLPNGRARPQTPEEWRAFVAGTAGSWADLDAYEDPEELPYDREDSLF